MRRVLPSAAVATTLALLVACNMITGEHDRVLDEGLGTKDGGKQNPKVDGGPDGPDPIPDPTKPKDGGPTPDPVKDADVPDNNPQPPQPQTITLGTNWVSPNNGAYVISGGTIRISSHTPPANHPMLLPTPMPNLPANYKVVARIRADAQGEYGVLVRGKGSGAGFSAIVLSSRYSDGNLPNRPFLSPIAVATDNPTPGTDGLSYVYTNNKVWVFEVEAKDATITGKIFQEDNPGVGSTMTFTDPSAAADRGRQVGFVAYPPGTAGGQSQAVLLDYKVTFTPP